MSIVTAGRPRASQPSRPQCLTQAAPRLLRVFLAAAVYLTGCGPAAAPTSTTAASPAAAGPTRAPIVDATRPITRPTAPAGAPASTLDAGQRVGGFLIDRHEVTIGQFRAFAEATGTRTRAEQEGGGHTYEGGWVRKPGWSWAHPYGQPGADDEPAVHLTWAEAGAYCRWAGRRLPTDGEWVQAAYTESRTAPPAPFERGRTYRYPTGETAQGANYCDRRCENGWRDETYDDGFARHAPVRRTSAGVNGLWDMGANVWEWIEDGTGAERITRGGSWWYGADKMLVEPVATKPPDFYAAYIGFRCAADAP